jgi:Flp pilus assembly protein TadD
MFGIPINASDLMIRGIHFGNKGDWVSALTNFQKAFELEPNNIVASLNMAVAHRNLLNWGKNAEALEMAMKLNPNDWRVWAQKGISLSENKLFEDAITAIKKSIELKPEESKVWNIFAKVLIDINSLDEAKSAVEKALELDPKNDYAWFNLACLHSLKGNKKSTLENLQIAIGMNPNIKQNAKADKDFCNLWEDDEFKRITS